MNRGSIRWGRSRRLPARAAELGDRIAAEVDRPAVLARCVEVVHELLEPGTTTVWTLRDGVPVRAYWLGGEPGEDASGVPGVVLACARRGRITADPVLAEAAAPLAIRGQAVTDVLHVTGHFCSADDLTFLAAVARETAHSLEAADLLARALREAEKSRAILARVADAVVVSDASGTVTQCNLAAAHLTNLTADDAIGQECAAVLQLHDGERALDCTGGCPLVGSAERELWRPIAGGGRQPVLASAESVGDGATAVQVVHTVRDITRLKQADEAKTLFLATATHELKTPLTVIKGFADVLVDDADSLGPDGRASAYRSIAKRSDELAAIVERLLLTSRIEAGRVEVRPTVVDLGPLLDERVVSMAIATGRDVVADTPDDLPPVLADAAAVATVVEHLLDNAVKYSPEGGPVSLVTRLEGDHVVIRVTDSGVGMDEEELAHCWDKFWQGDSTGTRRFGGTGIGLYIVRSLAEAMGGTVAATSRKGEGSTLSVSLPAAAVGDAAPAPAASARKASTILEVMRQIGIPDRRSP